MSAFDDMKHEFSLVANHRVSSKDPQWADHNFFGWIRGKTCDVLCDGETVGKQRKFDLGATQTSGHMPNGSRAKSVQRRIETGLQSRVWSSS